MKKVFLAFLGLALFAAFVEAAPQTKPATKTHGLTNSSTAPKTHGVDNTVSLAWDAVDSSYQVNSYNMYDGDQVISNSSYNLPTTFTASNLSVGPHHFSVTAVNATGESPHSNTVDYTVDPALPLPPAPGNLHQIPAGLAQMSTRARVGVGEDVIVGGIIISGEATQVIVRAIGASLQAAGVNGALIDPVLELHDADGNLITTNDNWSDSQASEITASGVAPKDYRESAISALLDPGLYTAIVRGKNNTSGVALVEFYHG